MVQFGLAMSLLFFVSAPLISGTTKGMSLSYRKADYSFVGVDDFDVMCEKVRDKK